MRLTIDEKLFWKTLDLLNRDIKIEELNPDLLKKCLSAVGIG
jgi:hypothetical protein